MKGVKFITPFPPYKVGDIAGFNESEADKLVKEEIAEFLKPERVEVKEVVKPPVDKMIKSPKIKK